MRLHARLFVIGALAGIAAACSSPAGTPTPIPARTPAASTSPVAASEPAPTANPTSPATVETTTEPSAPEATTTDANTFVSPHYNYALTLPPGTALLGWHGADRPWDGVNSVNEDSQYVDRTSVAEGGLYILGSPADDLDEFFTRFESNGPRAHTCDAAKDRVDTVINGVPAIAFTQVCGSGEGFGRLVVVKDGFGIGASIHTEANDMALARDRLIELLGGLEWRTS